MSFNSPDTSKTDAFTQSCRDFIRTFTYEDILACTIYAPPLFFMVGPAAILANDLFINLILHAILGFALSGTLHRTGHRLLIALPKQPQTIYLSRSICLPVKLTLGQFLWMMELIVGTAVFSGILAKRLFVFEPSMELLASLSLFTLAFVLFFIPVYLGRLWIERYYPAMALLGPTEDVIVKSFPGVRSFFK